MERPDTAGAYDSRPTDEGARAERSRRRSAESSSDGQEKDGTATAGGQPKDFAVELSLLQSVYEQAIVAGLWAKATEQVALNGQMPVLTIQLWNVSKCPTCESWITGLTCPMC